MTVPSPPSLCREGRISVAIELGSSFASVAYSCPHVSGGEAQQILSWPGSFEILRKVPTSLLYDWSGEILAWGMEAKYAEPIPGSYRYEWLSGALLNRSATHRRHLHLPPGKQPVDIIIDYLRCLWVYIKENITRETGIVSDLDTASIWLNVPSSWEVEDYDMLRYAAITAGLVQSVRAGDYDWRDRLKVITESEAAVAHCTTLPRFKCLDSSQNFIVCNAGDETIDLSFYQVVGEVANLEVTGLRALSKESCGSQFLDFRFKELVKALLADHPAHLDLPSLAYFIHTFNEADKFAYKGAEDDGNIFHFNCFNVEDPHAPEVGLVNGQLAIPGCLLRREVFDPVIEQVLEFIEDEIKTLAQNVDALLLVGSFSECEYLKSRIEEHFCSKIRIIERPKDADTAIVRGAARYGSIRQTPLSAWTEWDVGLAEMQSDEDEEVCEIHSMGSAICKGLHEYPASDALSGAGAINVVVLGDTDNGPVESEKMVYFRGIGQVDTEIGRGEYQPTGPIGSASVATVEATPDIPDEKYRTSINRSQENSVTLDPEAPANKDKKSAKRRQGGSRKNRHQGDLQSVQPSSDATLSAAELILNTVPEDDPGATVREDDSDNADSETKTNQEPESLLEKVERGYRQVSRFGKREWMYTSKPPKSKNARRHNVTIIVNAQENCGNNTHVRTENSHNDSSHVDLNAGNTHNTNNGSGVFNNGVTDQSQAAEVPPNISPPNGVQPPHQHISGASYTGLEFSVTHVWSWVPWFSWDGWFSRFCGWILRLVPQYCSNFPCG